LVEYSIYDALQAGFDKSVVVIRKHLEHKFNYKFGDKLKGKAKVVYAYQENDTLPDEFATAG
jgi:dTDP-glucose pyrophosphorylase